MASTKYLGYVGGVAVAVGVGAAVAAASQGVAHADDADTGSQKSTNAGPVQKAVKKAAAEARENIHEAVSKIADATAGSGTDTKAGGTSKVSDTKPFAKLTAQTTKPKFSEAEQVKKLQNLFQPKASSTTNAVTTNATAAVHDSNPFRADDPDPTDMPAAVLKAEKALLAQIPESLAPVAPVVREGYEAAYRASQMVPYVNVPVPLIEILPALAKAAAGDKAGAQIVVNQLLLTTPTVSLLYYGYDEAADLLNVEPEAEALKQQVYATAWDTLDPLGLLHPVKEAQAVDQLQKQFALSSVTPQPDPAIEVAEAPAWSPNPFRADDPAPLDMPPVILGVEQQLMNAVPVLAPFTREGVELTYRVSQMIPWLNVIFPVINVFNDLPAAFGGDKTATQAIINNLLATTQPVSILYYGWDEVFDLLNLEAQGDAGKDWFFKTSWNLIDFFDLLHVSGDSGVPLNPNDGWQLA